jgi:hypothetical protein
LVLEVEKEEVYITIFLSLNLAKQTIYSRNDSSITYNASIMRQFKAKTIKYSD